MAKSGKMVYELCVTTLDPNTNTMTREAKPEWVEMRNALRTMSYGKDRRAAIMKFINQGGEFYVNKKHTPQTKQDPDILYLIKHKHVEMVNEHFLWGKRTFIRKPT